MVSKRVLGSVFLAVLGCYVSFSHAFEPIEFENVYFAAGRPRLGENVEQSLESETHMSLAGALDIHLALDEALDTLNRNPKLHVLVKGYADAAECVNTDCQTLSDRRAQVVSEWLVKRGIDSARLEIHTGFGVANPRARDGNIAHRWLNRRVELEVAYSR